MDNSDVGVLYRNLNKTTKEFSKEILKYGKPYLRELTVQLLAAGVPKKYLPYAFHIVFDKLGMLNLHPGIKSVLRVFDGIVTDAMVLPNYANYKKPTDDWYLKEIQIALKKTIKWILKQVKKINALYDRIALKNAVQAYRENDTIDAMAWYDNFTHTLLGASSMFVGGDLTASVLSTILQR